MQLLSGFAFPSGDVRHRSETTKGDTMTRMLAYLRVSRADRNRETSLGIEAQREAITAAAIAKGWEIVGWYEDDGLSGKDTNRPGLAGALRELRTRKRRTADGLVVAKLDRLSRSVIDFGELLDVSRRHRWAIAVLDFDLDTGTAVGRMLAGVMMQFAQFEREVIGERTSAALAVRKAEGIQLGKPSQISADVQAAILQHHRAGLSYSAIARRLESEGVPTVSGSGRWTHTVVGGVVRRWEGVAA
ncbi:recombinase family protein [Agromyces sp. Root81]|uniref:recombinase family protein n=1 Tax=Agromyces sp. Root81 TaxID=1736601 RepID=UPI001F2B7D3C|nr:recombinase family protein [Agromyces sp. Root81]